jgi:hypothetical protein
MAGAAPAPTSIQATTKPGALMLQDAPKSGNRASKAAPISTDGSAAALARSPRATEGLVRVATPRATCTRPIGRSTTSSVGNPNTPVAAVTTPVPTRAKPGVTVLAD